MKTYSFIVAIHNSTIIEVTADDINEAHDTAMNKLHDGGYLKDLCNPSDIEIDVEVQDEFEVKSAETFMVGTREEAEERCRELRETLGVWARGSFYIDSDEPNTQNPEDGERILRIKGCDLTDKEVEMLNLSEDFIITKQ
jgi:hypothetical protein